jgi:hypothetical protein
MSPKGKKQERKFPLVSRVCCLLSAPSRFRRKANTSPSATSKRFFWDLVSQGEFEASSPLCVHMSTGLLSPPQTPLLVWSGCSVRLGVLCCLTHSPSLSLFWKPRMWGPMWLWGYRHSENSDFRQLQKQAARSLGVCSRRAPQDIHSGDGGTQNSLPQGERKIWGSTVQCHRNWASLLEGKKRMERLCHWGQIS